jgi:hypothetical protein
MAAIRSDRAIGIFEHTGEAEQAVTELWKAGFPHDAIDLITRDGITPATPNLHLQTEAGNGALTGAIIGSILGALVGAVCFYYFYGIAAFDSGALIAGLIGGGALGAAGGAFLGPFVAMAITEDDKHYFAHAIDEGRTIVVVRVPHRVAAAQEILHRCGAQERRPAGV